MTLSLRKFSLELRAKRLSWRKIVRAIVPYGISLGCLAALQGSGLGEAANLLIYDTALTIRPAPSGATTPIRIIGLTESDIQRFGWPLNDGLMAKAVDRLLAQGVRGIGIDFYRDRGVEPGVQELRSLIRRHPQIITIFNAGESISSPPGTPLRQQSFNDLVVDTDGVIRRDLVHVEGQPPQTMALPLRLFELAQGNHDLRDKFNKPPLDGLWLNGDSGGYRQQDAAGLQRMLSFYQPNSFPSWSFASLLDGAIPASQFKGSIVLIGSRAASLRDNFHTPFTRFSNRANLATMDGVEVHAHRLASLLDLQGGGRFQMVSWPAWAGYSLLVGALLIGVVIGERPKSLITSALILVVAEAGLLLGSGGLLLAGQWVGISLPMAGLALMAMTSWIRRATASQEQRRQFERLLGQTTSPAVAAELWNQRETCLTNGRFPGRELPLTMMLADTVRFSSVGEWMAPTELLDWINIGMEKFVEIINRHGGMVNKFTGDGFLAVFGAPLSVDACANAEAAVSAAREIQLAITELLVELKDRDLPPIRLRIGICSGPVITGSMGGSSRMEYAVIGDAVNISARLESLHKERMGNDCRVLLASDTKDLLVEGRWRFADWGPQLVKGREQPVEVYELEGAMDGPPAQAS
jgi:adenylate cyclase